MNHLSPFHKIKISFDGTDSVLHSIKANGQEIKTIEGSVENQGYLLFSMFSLIEFGRISKSPRVPFVEILRRGEWEAKAKGSSYTLQRYQNESIHNIDIHLSDVEMKFLKVHIIEKTNSLRWKMQGWL